MGAKASLPRTVKEGSSPAMVLERSDPSSFAKIILRTHWCTLRRTRTVKQYSNRYLPNPRKGQNNHKHKLPPFPVRSSSRFPRALHIPQAPILSGFRGYPKFRVGPLSECLSFLAPFSLVPFPVPTVSCSPFPKQKTFFPTQLHLSRTKVNLS